MSNLAYNIYNKQDDNIIEFDFVNKKEVVPEPEPVADGKYDNRAGKKCEVYAFRTDEEIKAMLDVFDKHIAEAQNGTQRMLACRNKMLFVIGINIGIRASDLRLLTWDFFFEKMPDGSLKFRDRYNLRPKKTSKTNKYVELKFNSTVYKIIDWYASMYPIEDIKDYVFKSRQGNDAITVNAMWRVIKNAAKDAGIQQNIGTHSLRRTFCRRVYDNAIDKSQALIVLQKILNHSSSAVTLAYLGILNDEIDDVFDNLNLGEDFL